ncbi:D-alanyl-D-alanine carboxypeptidase family protein [Tissierella sp. MB52-C2]|uniref:D-alanyl-D-alanine carboxypeptidase family protein n=1 Tax=Tissierella sp. MB52-C2 TaxID=3070999 RepID=UPI00280B3394|nr:D-alanyl-D-alanine carboxypeptidase family protein [Tissierella sp. MB52-C2]WMM26490.1 D-alanyl-D-alanine carboxypeptidase family protein [Tissierella sp. MB52-C2]
MKKKICLIIIIIMTLSSSIVFGQELSLSGQSYILMDAETGRVLYERNAHKKMPMASTTKIMTALVALENGKLDDKIVAKGECIGVEGSSIYLKEGEVISLKDMLYGLMLRSGNDSSVAIANHIGGSLDGFVSLMNKKAESIGAVNTNFANPHGLHDDSHYSTAYDLALITKEAFSYEEFGNIVKSKSYTADREENNYFYNKNKTLWEYTGGDGVKTGYTMRSGRCLVSSATRNGMHLIAVSLNAGDWFNDNYKLLNYGFDNYSRLFVYDNNQFIERIDVENGNRDYLNLVTENSFFYPFKEGERESIKLSIDVPDTIEAPIEKGDKIGSIYTYLDGKLVHEGNLVAKSTIKRINKLEKLLNNLKIK